MIAMNFRQSLDEYTASLPGRCPHGVHHERQPGLCKKCPPAPSDEWSLFVAALRQAVGADGLIHQRDVRPALRGRIAPKHVGTLYRRAKAEGLLRDTGEREPSDDVIGRNSDKLDRVYAWVGGGA